MLFRSQISLGTYVEELPVYNSNVVFKIQGKTYSGFTTQQISGDADVTKTDYPVDEYGYPKSPPDDETFFFQKGAGWFELVKDHQSLLKINKQSSVFTGMNFSIQTEFEQFTYGQKYLDRFRYFPYMKDGFKLRRIPDNRKSWPVNDTGLRRGNGDVGYNAYYFIDNDKLALNVKNPDIVSPALLTFVESVIVIL